MPPLVEGLPKILTLEECEFPIVPSKVVTDRGSEYDVLVAPQRVRGLFDDEGAQIVRVNSLRLAAAIPDFKGKGSGSHSLLVHQDHEHPARDPRRFLMLSKTTSGPRGSSTIFMGRNAAEDALAVEEDMFADEMIRAYAGSEREYDARFTISREQYDRCFDDPIGYECLIDELVAGCDSRDRRLAIRLSVLGFLIRGEVADLILPEVLKACAGRFVEEAWEKAGVAIIDNSAVFHARLGGNDPPLQRNFCI